MKTEKQIKAEREKLAKNAELQRIKLEKDKATQLDALTKKIDAEQKALEKNSAAKNKVLDLEEELINKNKQASNAQKLADEAKKELDKKNAELEEAKAKCEQEPENNQVNVNENVYQNNGKKILVRSACAVLVAVGLLGALHHIGKKSSTNNTASPLPTTHSIATDDLVSNNIATIDEQGDAMVPVVEEQLPDNNDEMAKILVAADAIYNDKDNDFLKSMGFQLEDIENVVAILNNQEIINQEAIINSAQEVEIFLNATRNQAIMAANSFEDFNFDYASLYANDTNSMEYKVLNAIDMSYDSVNNLQSAIDNIDLCVDVLLGKSLSINGTYASPINILDEKAMGVLSYATLAYDAYDSIMYNNYDSILMDEGEHLDEKGNPVVGVVEGRRQSFSITLHNIDEGCQNNLELTRGN